MRDVLTYVEAILRVYNQYGRRDNIYKARIKILVHELGAEAFARRSRPSGRAIKDGALGARPAAVAEIAAPLPLSAITKRLTTTRRSLPRRAAPTRDFARLAAAMPSPITRLPGYAIVDVSLKPEARRRATPPPSRWTRSPIWPTAIPWARSGSATSRIWSCRM